MKNVIIVLLVAALGAGAYFYFGKKRSSTSDAKELIVGKWVVDSLDASRSKDSSAMLAVLLLSMNSDSQKFQFDFRKDGLILEGAEEKTKDTSHYEFIDDKTLLLWSQADTTKTKWNITKLDSSDFVIQSLDSLVYYFQRTKAAH